MSNAFDLLGLPLRFSLEKELLDKQYFLKQAQVHPDVLIGADQLEKERASHLSAALNTAYQTLKNPQKRAEELLKAKNIPLPGANGKTIASSPLLSEVMTWREQIQEREDLSSLHHTLTKQLGDVMGKMDTSPPSGLPECYLTLVYIQKTLDELELVFKT